MHSNCLCCLPSATPLSCACRRVVLRFSSDIADVTMVPCVSGRMQAPQGSRRRCSRMCTYCCLHT